MRKSLYPTLVLYLSATFAAFAQPLSGDLIAGLTVAETVCVECHHIYKDNQTTKIESTPTFQQVANDPAVTELSLRVFFQTPHANMPNLILTENETIDIIAYILSLK